MVKYLIDSEQMIKYLKINGKKKIILLSLHKMYTQQKMAWPRRRSVERLECYFGVDFLLLPVFLLRDRFYDTDLGRH